MYRQRYVSTFRAIYVALRNSASLEIVLDRVTVKLTQMQPPRMSDAEVKPNRLFGTDLGMIDLIEARHNSLTEREGLPAAAVPITAKRARTEHFMFTWVIGWRRRRRRRRTETSNMKLLIEVQWGFIILTSGFALNWIRYIISGKVCWTSFISINHAEIVQILWNWAC